MDLFQNFSDLCANVGQQLWNEFSGIGKILAPKLSVIFFTIAGFRIMFLITDFVQEMLKFTMRAFLIYIILFSPFIQPILQSAIPQLNEGGGAFAQKIVQLAPSGNYTSGNSDTPMDYWKAWLLGGVGKSSILSTDNRMSMQSVLTDIWGMGSWWDNFKSSNFPKLQQAIQSFGPIQMLTSGVGNFLNVLFSAGLLIFMVMFMLLPVLWAILMSIGVLVMALFAWLGGLVAPMMGFYVVMGLGAACAPLILFDAFADNWQRYIVFLVGCVLAIFFYHIFSAIGFVLADGLYYYVFKGSGSNGGYFAQMIGNTLDVKNSDPSSMLSSLANFVPGIDNFFKGIAQSTLLEGLIQAAISLALGMGLWMAGVTILASICSFGIGTGIMGVRYSLKWTQAFVDESLIEHISRGLTSLNNASQRGFGQLASKGVELSQQMGPAAGRLFSGAGSWIRGRFGR